MWWQEYVALDPKSTRIPEYERKSMNMLINEDKITYVEPVEEDLEKLINFRWGDEAAGHNL